MILSLADIPDADNHVDADVAIVGAGIAGLILAKRLKDAGLRVVVLESGDAQAAEPNDPSNDVVQTSMPYSGARDGRVRGLGGTSQIWGGALLPFVQSDMNAHPAGWSPSWPIDVAELLPHLDWLEKLFGLSEGAYDIDPLKAQSLAVADFSIRAPKWPVFRQRNIANVLRKDLARADLPVWVNATVTGFVFGDSGRILAIEARSRGGGLLTVRARHFVVCAGAIESTRLLLLINRACGERAFDPEGPLGRYFHDHLSAKVAKLRATDRARANKAFAFRFTKGGMRSMRYELTPQARDEGGLPAAFVHLSFSDNAGGGFAVLRDIFQAVQRGRLPSAATWFGVLREAPWIARAGYWRFIHKRVLAAAASDFEVHVVTEQFPSSSNRITLAEDRQDRFGLPLASIHWEVSQIDVEMFEAVRSRFLTGWERGPQSRFGALAPYPMESAVRGLREGGGIYHPGGTARMGRSADAAVVDRNLTCFAIPNVSVASTATLPTGGGANPTLTLLLLTCRMADHLIHLLRPVP